VTTLSPSTLPPEIDPAARRRLRIEIAIVLGIAVLPDIANAALSLVLDDPGETFWGSIGLLDRSVRVGLALLLVMWRSGLAWRDFGVVPVRWVRDPLLGLALWLATFAALNVAMYGGGGNPFGFHALPAEADPLAGAGWGLLAAIAIANGFAEELALRGYLIPALERLWGRSAPAILLTTFLASAYHIYGGPWSVIDAGVYNLFAGMLFAATRRLWPVVFAHMLGDFLPFVLYGS
jgi:membrane protease YdiL (CAAX protease family)